MAAVPLLHIHDHIRKQHPRPAIIVLGVALALSSIRPPDGRASDPSGDAPESGLIHYYSTIAPPANYPGPTPSARRESNPMSAPAPAPASVPDPAMPSHEPVPETEPQTPLPDSDFKPEPEAEPEARSEPGSKPDAEAVKLASANPADRLPDAMPEPKPEPAAPDHETDPIGYAKAAMAACKARFQGVRDYSCLFVKRERIDGRMTDAQVLAMKARPAPKSVYFKFLRPNAGREAIYVRGRFRGNAVVHDVGLGKLVAGTLLLNPRSARAMDGNRHPITEAGIGHMIDTIIAGWNREMNPRDSVVTVHPTVLVNKRPCTMIVSNHPRHDKNYQFHEVRVYIDHELGLPTRFEAYDWPRRPGASPPLVEEYTYLNLRLNVGLTDADFDPSNKAYSFGRF